MPGQIGRRFLGRREADRQQLATELLDLAPPRRHLAEVRPAGQSGQMTQKHKDQRPRREIREADACPIGALKRTIGDLIAYSERHV